MLVWRWISDVVLSLLTRPQTWEKDKQSYFLRVAPASRGFMKAAAGRRIQNGLQLTKNGGWGTLPLNRSEKTFWIGLSSLLVVICAVFLAAPGWTYHPTLRPQSDMGNMSHMSGMGDMADMPGMQNAAAMEETPAQKAKHLADKRESE